NRLPFALTRLTVHWTWRHASPSPILLSASAQCVHLEGGALAGPTRLASRVWARFLGTLTMIACAACPSKFAAALEVDGYRVPIHLHGESDFARRAANRIK